MSSPRRYDEDDIRTRPSRRGSRPRTKVRPAHEDAVVGMVIAVDRGRWTVLVDGQQVTAMRARELGRSAVVVGDRVGLVGDVTGAAGSLARIVRIEPRRTVLRRTADDTDPYERVIVANADRLAIVTALADPPPRPRMIDRCLVAAYDAGMEPLLVLTKADLAEADPFLAQYSPLALPHVVTTITDGRVDGLEQLREHLADSTTVLVGHSGVGKSTLVNILAPQSDRAVGQVNAVTGRGRHTSTSAVALALPGGGWVVDTPGVRSFGLAHIDPDRIVHLFPDLAGGLEKCPRGCSHDEAECGLDAYVSSGGAGSAGPARLSSMRRLLGSRGPATDADDGR